MPAMIRTFIAIELDDATQDALDELVTQLKRQPGSNAVRWVATDNIHLTLKFLGDVVASTVPDLQRAVADACVAARTSRTVSRRARRATQTSSSR